MPRRHQSRECALQVLCFMDSAREGASESLARYWRSFAVGSGGEPAGEPFEGSFGRVVFAVSADSEARRYVEEIVTGVEAGLERIDAAIESRSINWRMARMSLVDRNIMRLAVYELLFREDVPAKVVLDEAIELAKKFGSVDSRSFVNGILDGVYCDLRGGK